MQNINEKFKYLNIGLPEDILRRKLSGDFDGALRLIERRLKMDIPEPMKDCLIVERELIKRLPNDYPFTRAQALTKIRAAIPDFTDDEFNELLDDFKIDWIYVDGEERFFDRFYETLLKVNAEFLARTNEKKGHIDGEDDEDKVEEGRLDRVMRLMKTNGRNGFNLRIRASVKIDEDSFEPGKRVRVHLPIPAVSRQQSNIVLHSIEPAPKYIAPEDAEQRTVYWEEVMEENHPFTAEYSYDSKLDYIDPLTITPDKEQPDFFTSEQPPHIVFTPYIKALVETLAGDTDNPVIKAQRFYDFITKNVKYSFMREYFGLTDIAENCARNLRGDCGVQALLFITLCRCAGIPAKWQSGLNSTPESVGAHDWAEFYVAPYGWMFADPSFGGGAYRVGAEERRKFYFGNLDPFRMVANREFMVPLDPPKAQWRADPYDNQSGEIEYDDRGLTGDEMEFKRVMTAHKELY